MAGEEIGALFVKIGADVTGLKSGLTEGAAATDGFSAKINSGIASIVKFGAALAAIGVIAVAGGLIAATVAAANFQTKMTQLKTGAGETDAGLKVVSAGILDMAGKVGQSAGALADGMFMIESAGYHGAAGLKVLQAAAEGAKVGNANLATVADAVTTVLSDYHLGADGAADATNFLVAVVSEGKTHMEDLAGSLAHVLPFASALKIPLDQIGGAMATMTAKGIPAADAATYLRFTMASLANETPKGTKALKEIGLTSEEVSGVLTSKGLLPALQLIQEQLSKKFPKGGAAMFAALSNIVGGTRGLSAALQLTGLNLSDFVANTATITDKIKSAKGQVLGWSDIQKDFNFQVQAGEAALGAAGIKIGTKLLPVLTQLFQQVVPLVPKLTDMGTAFLDKVLPPTEQFAKWLTTLGPDFKKAYDIFSTLSPYLLAVGAAWALWNVGLAVTNALNFAGMAAQFVGGLIAIVRSAGLATVAQWALNIALDATPIGLILIALAALAAAFVYAYTHSKPFHDFVNALWASLQGFWSFLVRNLKPELASIGEWLGNLGGEIASLGATAHRFHIPGFATGGIVPGPVGAPMIAVVHGGERVLTPAQQRQAGTGGGNTYVMGGGRIVANTDDLLAALYTLMQEAQYRRGRGRQGALGSV